MGSYVEGRYAATFHLFINVWKFLRSSVDMLQMNLIYGGMRYRVNFDSTIERGGNSV